jgi:hypothetical protein
MNCCFVMDRINIYRIRFEAFWLLIYYAQFTPEFLHPYEAVYEPCCLATRVHSESRSLNFELFIDQVQHAFFVRHTESKWESIISCASMYVNTLRALTPVALFRNFHAEQSRY